MKFTSIHKLLWHFDDGVLLRIVAQVVEFLKIRIVMGASGAIPAIIVSLTDRSPNYNSVGPSPVIVVMSIDEEPPPSPLGYAELTEVWPQIRRQARPGQVWAVVTAKGQRGYGCIPLNRLFSGLDG